MAKVILSLICLFVASVPTAPNPANPTLFAASEFRERMPLSNTSYRICIKVRSDGRFHLERRVQAAGTTSNSLGIYESILNPDSQSQLRDILGDLQSYKPPAYVPPSTPLSISTYQFFHVEFADGKDYRRAGYLAWNGFVSPDASPGSAPPEDKKNWLQSERALEPLVQWIHNLESSKLNVTQHPIDGCGV
ncbi:MAG TPA: hypothetical protein VK578_19630 [Edaphobacter sp.]|nr:hypothetical protein [Edaphobacter sp.]